MTLLKQAVTAVRKICSTKEREREKNYDHKTMDYSLIEKRRREKA